MDKLTPVLNAEMGDKTPMNAALVDTHSNEIGLVF